MFCANTRGAKEILKSLGSQLISDKYHENKVFAFFVFLATLFSPEHFLQ